MGSEISDRNALLKSLPASTCCGSTTLNSVFHAANGRSNEKVTVLSSTFTASVIDV